MEVAEHRGHVPFPCARIHGDVSDATEAPRTLIHELRAKGRVPVPQRSSTGEEGRLATARHCRKEEEAFRWVGTDAQVGGDSGTSAGDADVCPQTIDRAHRLVVFSAGVEPLLTVIRDSAPRVGAAVPHLPSVGQCWRVPT